MKKLTDLEISPVYEPSDDIEGFYNDTLSVAKLYQRVSAYFDSKLFKYISKGVMGLIKNKGKMQLILSTEVSETTMKDIKKGYESRFIKSFVDEITFPESYDYKEDIKELSFLISIGLIDVKIALKEKGILHEKYGIVYDNYDNKVMFSGSNNETEAALQYNYESFETTTSWDKSSSSIEKIRRRKNSFERLWNNQDSKLIVVEASDYLEKRLLKEVGQNNLPKLADKIVFMDLIDGKLIVKTNFKNDVIIHDFMFKDLKGKINSKDDNFIELAVKTTIKDIDTISMKIERICEKKGLIYIIGKNIKTFTEENRLDLEYLSIVGNHIKSNDIYEDSDFIDFFSILNNLLKRPLRKAQAVSSYHFSKIGRVMNFSVPGSGKTATILGTYAYLRDLGKIDKIVVIGPINCFKAWKEEYQTVISNSNEFDILDLHEAGHKMNKEYFIKYDYPKSKVVLINFEGLGVIADKLAEVVDSKTMIVFDEIHRIKNPSGIRYADSKKIVEKAKYIAALTGTPLPNGYRDLHNLFEILYGEYSKSYFNFSQERLNELMKKYLESGIEDQDLNTKIYPFFTRVSKRDLEVEPVEPDNVIYVKASEEENRLYSEIFDNKDIGSLAKITHLMRVGSNLTPLLDESQSAINAVLGFEEDYEINNNLIEEKMSTKIKESIKIIVDLVNAGKNVVVWAVFIKTINMIKYHLDKKIGTNISQKIYGEIDNDQRDKIINAFNKGEIKVIITNPHTLAESVSLHKSCHDAVYVELNFNLSQYLQSRDRIHRLGIPSNTKTNYYIMLNRYENPSIEERIYEKLGVKAELMYSSIDKGELMSSFDFDKDLDELLKR